MEKYQGRWKIWITLKCLRVQLVFGMWHFLSKFICGGSVGVCVYLREYLCVCVCACVCVCMRVYVCTQFNISYVVSEWNYYYFYYYFTTNMVRARYTYIYIYIYMRIASIIFTKTRS